jgi:hypothetical protein
VALSSAAHLRVALSWPNWIGSKEGHRAMSERVVIGMDPHERSVTIEVMTADESGPSAIEV